MDIGDTKRLSELRIVLMGHRRAGKSSTGNTILGQEEFDLKSSAQCVKKHRDVADTHITVIEAPGWWRYYTVEESPEILKQEIVFSVSQCPPGPHALLLIIRVGYKFKETERKAVEAHVSLLGERVWSHTIVVFTHGDSLSDTSIEQHIESEGQELQLLLDKCGNRYHLLNNHNRSNDTQIKELLEKIEEMQNNGCHFEIDRKILQEMKERRRADEDRTEERMKRMKKQRENIRSQMSDSQHLSELRIVLMGWKASGKSSAGNALLGQEEFDLKSSAQCVRRDRDVADTHITVIEAPGWWKFSNIEKSTEKQELVLSVSQCPPGPHALLLIIRVDTKVKHFMRRTVEAHVSLLGERVWSHTIVVFTHGDSLSDMSIEQHIESEGQELQMLLDKCGNRYHLLNNHNRSDDTQIKELLEKIEETVAINNGRHFKIDRKILQEMIKSKYNGSDSCSRGGSLISRARSFLGSLFRDSSHTEFDLGAIKQHTRNEFPQPNFADGDRSWMIESSSIRIEKARSVGLPPTIADGDRLLVIEPRRNQSVGLPPTMRAHGSSIKWFQRNSDKKAFSPQIKAEGDFSSSCSITSTVSSGYGSLLSVSESVEDSEYKRKNMSMSSERHEDLKE